MLFPAAMSNSTSLSEEASVSSGTRVQDFGALNPLVSTFSPPQQQQQKVKKKRSLPGNPDPDAEVIALSPKTLLATNRFVCEICNKGFQRDQNLQLHRRGHNLPWKLKQRNSKEVKKRAYVCPEPSCVHHHPSRALGDLTGIKKHYCRKHGEKKWKCEKCSKIYAVQSDWKAHSKTCGTREYRCDCGTIFSRKDSFITHRAFCDALAEESARLSAHQLVISAGNIHNSQPLLLQPNPQARAAHFPLPVHNSQQQASLAPTTTCWDPTPHHQNSSLPSIKPDETTAAATQHFQSPSLFHEPPRPPALSTHKGLIASVQPAFQNLSNPAAAVTHHLSATALLQKATSVGATQAVVGQHGRMSQLDMASELGANHDQIINVDPVCQISQHGTSSSSSASYNNLGSLAAAWQKSDHHLTRDFLGLTGDHHHAGNRNNGSNGANNAGVYFSMGSNNNNNNNVREMLPCTGGVGRFQQFGERAPSGSGSVMLMNAHPHSFGFPAAAPAHHHHHHNASETWGDC